MALWQFFCELVIPGIYWSFVSGLIKKSLIHFLFQTRSNCIFFRFIRSSNSKFWRYWTVPCSAIILETRSDLKFFYSDLHICCLLYLLFIETELMLRTIDVYRKYLLISTKITGSLLYNIWLRIFFVRRWCDKHFTNL